MKLAMFCHSLLSDWNHGNAHFLRGIATELAARGHEVRIFEPARSWSLRHLVSTYGTRPVRELFELYPNLRCHRYGRRFDLERALDGVDVVIVHEWNEPALVARLGERRARTRDHLLLFHDTHHRAVTAPEQMAAFDLRHYDGVLAFGEIIREIYLDRGWCNRAWTWHEAADVRVFYPHPGRPQADLVWIGNWGDEERTAELTELLLRPVAELAISATAYGVRYPEHGEAAMARAGIEYRGWLPNFRVPEVFGHHRVTVHIPRRPYVEALPGIPTIRPFEALACGVPLISSPWQDCENLFSPGFDFLFARDGAEMQRLLRTLLLDPETASALARHGQQTILDRHTCGHRVDELLSICRELGLAQAAAERAAAS